MALALYRRYRPDTFEGVIGQDQVTVPLMRALDSGKLTHAYLFSGPRGCGKTSSARILARCINCAKGPTSHPCGECASCKDLATGGPGSIDVVEIDAASHNGVDDARELRERAGFAPARDRYKIFILDEAHMVTQQGFNALLKIVEEPPDHVMFIFATTEPDKVIGTIRSRTHHYPFRLVPQEVMGPYLEEICAKESIKPEPGVLKLAMRAGGGSVRDTLSVLDQLMVGAVDGVIAHDAAVALLGFTPEALIGEAVDAVIARNGEALYGVVQKVVVGGFDPRRFVEDLLARVRDLLVLTLGGAQAESVLSDAAEAEDMDDLRRQASSLGLGALTSMAETINTTLGSMTGAISPRMRLELLAARLLAGREGLDVAPAAGGTAPGADSAGTGRGAAGVNARTGGIAESRSGGTTPRRGGFIGSARNQQTDARQSATSQTNTSPSRTTGTQPDRALQTEAPTMAEAPATADAQAGAPSPAAQAPSAARVPSAGEPTATQSSPQDDDRTPDERWDALVAGLPADVAAYVNRSKVPRIHLEQHEPGGKGTLWIKFDKALSKYAFAKAVAGEEVGGTRNVVQIMRAETRKAFGDQVQLAPTKKMADGQVAPPFGQLPADEQQRISAQIVKASLSASLGAMSVGNNAKEPQTPPESGDTASADTDEVHRAVPDAPDATVAHDRDNNRAVAQDISHADAQSAVDPWALPEAGAGDAWSPTDDASHNVSRDVSRDAPQDEGHHAKHIAVPDLSDDTDPWANDGGNSMPVDGVRGGDAPGTPQNVAHAQSQSREDSERTNPGPTAVPESMSAEDPWAGMPSSVASASSSIAAPSAGSPAALQGPSDDLAAPGRPENPGVEPGTTHLQQTPGAAAGQRASRPAYDDTDPFSGADPYAQEDIPMPTVAPEDDEYSMNDVSLGSPETMSLDDVKQFFEVVKPVEEYGPDDPKNPRNIQHVNKHDSE